MKQHKNNSNEKMLLQNAKMWKTKSENVTLVSYKIIYVKKYQ